MIRGDTYHGVGFLINVIQITPRSTTTPLGEGNYKLPKKL